MAMDVRLVGSPDDGRHHGRVDHMQRVDAVNLETTVDHGPIVGVGAHAAGAGRVVPAAHRRPDVTLERVPVVRVGRVEQPDALVRRGERAMRRQTHDELQALDESREVARVGEHA